MSVAPTTPSAPPSLSRSRLALLLMAVAVALAIAALLVVAFKAGDEGGPYGGHHHSMMNGGYPAHMSR